MSRRTLLALGGGSPSVIIPTDPPDGGGGDPDTPEIAWPETDDPIILAMRPQSVFASSSVAEGGDIGDAVLANRAQIAANVPTADHSAGYANTREFIGPEFVSQVFLAPGTYDEGVGTDEFEGFVGLGATPADTVIATAKDWDGVYHLYGASYNENLTFKALTDETGEHSPKWVAHIFVGRATYFVNCVFDARDGHGTLPGYGTGGCIGMDGDDGTVLIFYKCTFISGATGTGDIAGHGTSGAPLFVGLIDCDFQNPEGHPNRGHIGLAGNGGDEQSRWYILGCTGINQVTINETMDLYTDLPDDVLGPVIANYPDNLHRGVTEWPLPVDGLIDQAVEYYRPSVVPDAGYKLSVDVSDEAPMTVVPDRHYIMHVPSSVGMRAGYVGFNAATSSGNFQGLLGVRDTLYVRGTEPPALSFYATPKAMVNGDNVFKAGQAPTRYPGDNGYWVHMKFSDTAQVIGSADLPGLTECYYVEDGALVPVPEGTAFPLMFVMSD